MSELQRFIVDFNSLPDGYPTHSHHPQFWEALGRTVATFGFLEEMLCKAIFALTGTRSYSEDAIAEAYAEWILKLERSLSDPLGNLIDTYGKAIREHPDATVSNGDELTADLRAASKLRNVICHGSWKTPDIKGASKPFYINKQGERFDTTVDSAWLMTVQKHVLELICAVVNSVTHMGYQFPGSDSPGVPVWVGTGSSGSDELTPES